MVIHINYSHANIQVYLQLIFCTNYTIFNAIIISLSQFKTVITQKTIIEISTPKLKTAITQKYSELSYLRDIICKITTISILLV
jgi:hypothetical protein